MNQHAILVENLSKQYRIGVARGRRNGRATFLDKASAPFRYLASTLRPPKADELVWAIQDVSFQVEHGEVVGIIGRNGAGKSTLLKVLARITEPTSGRALIHGRVGSLLEVGTGFHPELTGRENTYLSGAILGMKRAEVDRKFDEIVAFADVERFLETPVKRYSSGMYVRLAFAVAAHLEPEILLVDEVLAVGDAAFQKKCLGKMGDVATQGRTVLFVSHNMVAVQNLCQRAVWLDEGHIREQGDTREVVADYLSAASQARTERYWPDLATAPGNEKVKLRRIRIQPGDQESHGRIKMDGPASVEVEFWSLAPGAQLHVCWHFITEQQTVAFTSASIEEEQSQVGRPMPPGLYRSVCHIPGDLLNEGTYHLKLLILRDTSKILFRLDDALTFEVVETGKRPGAWFGREPGAVRPRLVWKTRLLREMDR